MTTLTVRTNDQEPVPEYVRRLRLSLITTQIEDLLVEAAALQGLPRPTEARTMAPLLMAALHDGTVATARQVAQQANRDGVRAACAEVLADWQDHSAADFLESRLAEVVAKASVNGGGVTISAYHMALRDPERFCGTCGSSLTSSTEVLRQRCQACWIREAVQR